jgi:hypothetical protein
MKTIILLFNPLSHGYEEICSLVWMLIEEILMQLIFSATVVLPVVLYRREAWSLTLREEQRLRVFENGVLRRIFGPKRDEATGDWRRLHNEELNDLYSSPNIIRVIKSRRMKWAGM